MSQINCGGFHTPHTREVYGQLLNPIFDPQSYFMSKSFAEEIFLILFKIVFIQKQN